MLIIRLQRTGKKNQADFRIVLTEKAAPVKKKFLEVLGSYNPRKKYFQVKEDRLKYWLGQHVALSETLHNLLVTKGLVEGVKVKAFSIPKKPAAPVEAAKPADLSTEALAKVEAATETAAEVTAELAAKPAPAEEIKPAETPAQ